MVRSSSSDAGTERTLVHLTKTICRSTHFRPALVSISPDVHSSSLMKSMKLLCLAALTLATAAFAAPLSSEDAAILEKRANTVRQAFVSSSSDTIVEMTHPSLFKLVGGKEKLLQITKAAMEQLKSFNFEILDSKLGTPTETYVAGNELVCFYPMTMTIKVGDKQSRSIGFLICVRPAAGGDWLFLDASGLRKNPGLLKMLLPDLPADVPLPENRIVMVE